jgi:sodium/bile acid cotransporter 7
MRALARHWFLLALLGVTVLAWAFPRLGAEDSILHPGLSLHLAVQLAFLVIGLTLSTAAMASAIGRLRAHVAIQSFCFLVMPAACWLVALAVEPLSPPIAMGIRILGCLPTTIATAAIFTREAGGNEALALCNTTLSNLLGVIATPLLIMAIADRSGSLDIGASIIQLLQDVVAPFAIGQLARRPWQRLIGEPWPWLKQIPSCCVLLVGFLVFARSFGSGAFSIGPALAIAGGACLLVYAGAIAGAWLWGRIGFWRFDGGDRTAMLFCGAQKTLAVGVPLIAILYKGSPDLALYTLPILLYHPLQLVVGAASAPRLARQQVEPP